MALEPVLHFHSGVRSRLERGGLILKRNSPTHLSLLSITRCQTLYTNNLVSFLQATI